MSRFFLAGLALLVSLPAAVQADTVEAKFVRALDRMMVQMGAESARDARAIRLAYKAHLELLVLDEYSELEGALTNGGLAPLPPNPLRFNLEPRLTGAAPIGEKDLARQVSYIAARPSTIGCLFDVASRVKSGPVEVTSLVRHSEYQSALRTTNRNATTAVPMHTMGLAFDIALINTPLPTVYEIRDVLRQLRKEGKILFIGERKQLVFHVVPHPSRLGYFNDVYARAVGTPASMDRNHVVAFSSVAVPGPRKPLVSAEVVAVLPVADYVEEWWAADHSNTDVTVVVSPEQSVRRRGPDETSPSGPLPSSARAPALLTAVALVGLLSAPWWIIRQRPRFDGLFLSISDPRI